MSLCAVGHIAVASLTLKHPHIRVALALATVFAVDPERTERVIGTNNGKKGPPPCQLYGWAPNVGRHRDETGFVYFSPLLLRHSIVHTPRASVCLKRGQVYRLYDWIDHWTVDSAPVVCVFAGPMAFPLDRIACARLQDGVDALARGARDAPRVSKGFNVPLKGQCWADTPDGTDVVPIEEAKREGWLMARCALCERFAVRTDQYFPYQHELSRCAVHLKAVGSVTTKPLEAA